MTFVGIVMCRMLAVIPKKGFHVNSDIVRTFRELASSGLVKPGSKPGHGDGWGIIAWNEGVPTYFGRYPKNAWTDPNYEKACSQIEKSEVSSPLIVHFRKASVGSKTVSNTHPFVIGEWAFAHNGTIRKLNLKGKTDSEWFFELLMQENCQPKGDLLQSMKIRIHEVQDKFPYSSLTFLLSNGVELFAYRDCADNEKYYTMFFTETPESIVIAQEKFFDSDWKVLENGQLLHVADDEMKLSDLALRK
jgi:predicted glutamine amidotransferase